MKKIIFILISSFSILQAQVSLTPGYYYYADTTYDYVAGYEIPVNDAYYNFFNKNISGTTQSYVNITPYSLELGGGNGVNIYLNNTGEVMQYIGGIWNCTGMHNSSVNNTGGETQQIRSGTYTPTVTSVLNLTSVTSTQAQWIRVGNVVTVSGRFTADPINGVNTSFNLTLPIPSNLSNGYDCSGTSFCGSVSQGSEITGDVSLDKALVLWKALHVSPQTWSYTFTYTIY